MMAYQCDNEALDDIKQYGMVDTTHAASDGCKRQARFMGYPWKILSTSLFVKSVQSGAAYH